MTPETLLADALAQVQPPDPEWVASIAGDGIPSANWPGWARAMFAASPTLARALALGVAWLEAEAAWFASYQHGHTECPTCGTVHQCGDRYVSRHAPTPEAALHALADALRKEQTR